MISTTRATARYISKLSNKIRRKIDEFSTKGEFTGAQGKALHFILAQNDDIFQKDIEEEYGLRPPTATELLKKMEQNGLICREPAPYDARLKKIIVTDKALEYKEQVIGDLENLESELTRGVCQEDLEIFFSVIEKMLDNIS